MPSQLRFEGADLEELLEDIRREHGDDVAIAEANKLRKGGVAGFFAREVFEVVIDLDDSDADDAPQPTASSAPAPRRAAHSVLDLVDGVEDDFEGLADPSVVAELVRRSGPGPEDLAVDELGAPVQDEDLRHESDPFRAYRAGASPEPEPVAPDRVSLSTESQAFADVLAQIAQQTAGADPDEAAPTEPTAPRSPTAAAGADHEGPFRSMRDEAPVVDLTPPPVTSPPVRARVSAPVRRRSTDLDAPFDLEMLRRLGLPEHFCTGTVTAQDQLGALLELTAEFPVAPALPERGDAVIALIGDRRGMDRSIAHVTDRLGLNPDRTMVATRKTVDKLPEHRRIASIEDAAAMRRNWRRRSQPVLVVVDEPVRRVRTAWARHLLEALEPSAVWGVVEAQRKPEDVVDWSERLGGVDALAVCATDETSSPAAVLTTGIPVSLLDGRTATAARWAAVLDERLYVA